MSFFVAVCDFVKEFLPVLEFNVRVISEREPDSNVVIRAVRFKLRFAREHVDMESAVSEADERFSVELSDRQFTMNSVMRLNELEDGRQFASCSELTESVHDVTLNDFIINFFPDAGVRTEMFFVAVLIESSSRIEEDVVMFENFFSDIKLGRTFARELKET